MAKPKAPASSPFAALIGARRERQAGEPGTDILGRPDVQTVSHLDSAVARQLAKSVDPEYLKFTTYIRKTTHKRLKIQAVQQSRELSDLIEELIEKWLAGGTASPRSAVHPSDTDDQQLR